jgi:outer membrane protein assembly factor BamA
MSVTAWSLAWLLLAAPAPGAPQGIPAEAQTSVAAQTIEIVTAVRVHGNHTTPEADVLAIVGAVVGQPVNDTLLADVRRRLEHSGRFAGVEVRKRYVSIADPSQVLLVIVVDEKPGVTEDDLTPGPWRGVTASGMWLPVLNYQEGYGFTYGARISFVDGLGSRSRVSMPLTWGGERQARVELEKGFEGRAVRRLAGGGGISRRENPFYEIGDTRSDVWARVESAPRSWLRAGGGARLADVSFGDLDDRLATLGADVALDTRIDPAFPRNAVYAVAGFERLTFDAMATPVDAAGHARTSAGRFSLDGRGYVGLVRQIVLAVRGQAVTTTAPVPLYEQQLLGGIPSLRGVDVGSRAADNLAAVSGELLVPLTSPMNIGRFGLKLFVDAGTVYPHGASMADQQLSLGYGAGLFLNATVFSFALDVGVPEDGGGANAHVQFGVRLSR